MKKTALSLVLLLVALLALSLAGCSEQVQVTNTYTLEETVRDVVIDVSESNVHLRPSEDGALRVVCQESNRIHHAVEVTDGTLSIRDARQWYEHIGLSPFAISVTVYLPATQYERLTVKASSSDIDVADGFSFSEVTLNNSSGSTRFASDARGDLTASTSSGGITVEGTSCRGATLQSSSGSLALTSLLASGDLRMSTSSGGITVEGASCRGATLQSSSGSLALTSLLASGDLRMSTSSGGIRFHACDAATLDIGSSSGDIEGTLLTPKSFDASSSSGEVRVPYPSEGGACRIRSSSGDIHVLIGNE